MERDTDGSATSPQPDSRPPLSRFHTHTRDNHNGHRRDNTPLTYLQPSLLTYWDYEGAFKRMCHKGVTKPELNAKNRANQPIFARNRRLERHSKSGKVMTDTSFSTRPLSQLDRDGRPVYTAPHTRTRNPFHLHT